MMLFIVCTSHIENETQRLIFEAKQLFIILMQTASVTVTFAIVRAYCLFRSFVLFCKDWWLDQINCIDMHKNTLKRTLVTGFLLTTTKLKVWLVTQNQFNFTMKSNANFQFQNAFIFRKKLSILLMAETIFIYWLHEICLLYPVTCNRDSHRINMYFVD